MRPFALFAGTAHPRLADQVARALGVRVGDCVVQRFPDGETSVSLRESVRHRHIFILQPLSPPVNEHLVELMIFADACRRAAAERITAVIPYLGYARSDKRHGRREAITAAMVADVLKAVGIDHVVTVDLHAPQIEGFFHIPVDSLTAVPTLCEALADRLPEPVVVVAPDAGAVKRATDFAHLLQTSVIVLHKRRESGSTTHVTHLVGDVRDRACLIVDDMISTGGTIADGVDALLKAGARPEITVVATHGLFIPGSREKLSHPAIREIVVTDSLAVPEQNWPALRIVSLAPVLADAIKHLCEDGSVGKASS